MRQFVKAVMHLFTNLAPRLYEHNIYTPDCALRWKTVIPQLTC